MGHSERSIGMSTLLCKRPGFVFGMGREGRGSIPFLAQRWRRVLRFHDGHPLQGGIRSGHRIVKWFKGFPPVMNRHRPLLGRLPQRQKNNSFSAASSWGNPPRVLMILRSDRFSDSTLLVV